jgi:hypothetical protein
LSGLSAGDDAGLSLTTSAFSGDKAETAMKKTLRMSLAVASMEGVGFMS